MEGRNRKGIQIKRKLMFIEWVPTEKKDTMPHFLHSINIARGY